MNKIRTALEWISVPLFALMVMHMGGHGIFSLAGDHEGHAHAHENHEADESMIEHLLEVVLDPEVLVGVLLLIFFVWLWHRPALKRLVPCRHTCCEHSSPWPHILATGAFVLHFFPEALLRIEAINETTELMSIAALLAFGSHFFIDIIVGVSLSMYWRKGWQKALSMFLIASLWLGAMWLASQKIEVIHFEGVISIIGAFFLSMFVHWPCHNSAHTHG